MRLKIEKGIARGRVVAPPSKSISHRLLIAAALAQGVSTVRNISDCEDVLATVDCLNAMGASCEFVGADVVVRGFDARKAKPHKPLFCRESASTLRFLLPIAMLSQNPTVLEGAPGLMRRPMTVYEQLSAQKGLFYTKKENQITVSGPLGGGEYLLPGNVSSQFISGLLFALPQAQQDSILRLTTPIESRSYIELTLSALRTFGVSVVWRDAQSLYIKGGQAYKATDVTVEGDASGAAFLDALNLFGASVTVEGKNPDSKQGDAVYAQLFSALDSGPATISIADCPDLAPILFAVAAAKHGGTFLDTQRLKIKESDRAQAMAQELSKFGVTVTVNENTVDIIPSDFHAPHGVLSGHNDHRIVMALSVLLCITGGQIEDAEAVCKSYPAFFEHLRQLNIEVIQV